MIEVDWTVPEMYVNGFKHLLRLDFAQWQKGGALTARDFEESIYVTLGAPETLYMLCPHGHKDGHFEPDFVDDWCPGMMEAKGWITEWVDD